MTPQKAKKNEQIQELDQAIRERILAAGEVDKDGTPIAAIPASDKFGLAKQVGVELEDVEQRLDATCEQIMEEERLAVAPRYRLRGKDARHAKQQNP
jgi:hypothetical protein